MNTRERWTVGIGGVLALCIGIYSFVLDPLYSRKALIAKEIARKSLLVERYKNMLSEKETANEELKKLEEAELYLQKFLLKGDSPSLAAAELQKFLHEKLTSLNISIVSEKVMKPGQFDVFTVIPVELIIKSNLRKLTEFVYYIENAEKFINISRISMKIPREVRKTQEESIESKIETQGFFITPDTENEE